MRVVAFFLASSLFIAAVPAAEISAPVDAQYQQILNLYSGAIRVQQRAMLGAQMEADIDGSLPKLAKRGRMKVMRIVSMLGDINWQLTSFTGDDTVRKELIARYLSEEKQKKAYGAMNVSPSLYEFKIKAVLTEKAGTPEARTRYIFEVKPRRNAPGLFRGEVELDGATGMPLRESGQLVESPHFMLKKVKFARDYEMVDGISVLKHFESTADVRLFGPAELDIEFSNFKRLPAEQAFAGGF